MRPPSYAVCIVEIITGIGTVSRASRAINVAWNMWLWTTSGWNRRTRRTNFRYPLSMSFADSMPRQASSTSGRLGRT